MLAIAKGHLVAKLALAERVDFLLRCNELNWLELGVLMRAVAERLGLTQPTRAKPNLLTLVQHDLGRPQRTKFGNIGSWNIDASWFGGSRGC